MARLQHNPTRPDSGFRPIQVSDAQLSQMRAETDKIVRQMQNDRSEKYRQGQEQLKAMRENAEYTRRAEQRNYEIQQQNLRARQLEEQLKGETAQKQAAVNTEAAQQIFGSLAALSGTAAKAVQKRRLAQEERELDKSLNDTLTNLDQEQQLAYDAAEASMKEAGVLFRANINAQEGQGGDPLATSQARLADPELGHFASKGHATSIIGLKVPIAYEFLLNSNLMIPLSNGEKVPASTARSNQEASSVVSRLALNLVLKSSNLYGREPKFLKDGLRKYQEFAEAQQAGALKVQRRDNDFQTEELAFSMVRNNTNGLKEHGLAAFQIWKSLPHIGAAGAHDNIKKLALERTPNGQRRFTAEEIGELNLYGGDTEAEREANKYKNKHQARYAVILEEQQLSDIKYDRQQNALDDIEYKKDVDRTMELLSGENNTEANTREVIQYFRDTHPGKPIPSVLTQNLASFTIEAKEKLEAIRQLRAIPYGFVQAEDVIAAQKYGQEIYREIASRYEEQNKIWKSDLAKDIDSGFKTLANGVNTLGSQKANTNSSGIFLFGLRAEFKKRVTQSIKQGDDPTAAMIKHSADITNEASEGVRTPGNKWFRDISKPGGLPQYPGLTQGPLNAMMQAQRKREELADALKEKGSPEALLNTKGAVLSPEAVAAVVQNWNKPGFNLPPEIAMITDLTKLDPFVALNTIIRTETGQELPLPPSISSVSQTVSPAFRKLLYQTPSPARSTRGLGSANMFNPAIVPNGFGQLYLEIGQNVGIDPILLAANGEVESMHRADAVSHNGSSYGAFQINKAAHPNFFAQYDWKDPRANITYGAQYFKQLLDRYKDPVAAAMAYNAGPGNYDAYLRGELPDGPIKTEMLNHGKKFTKALYKYGGGGVALNNPALMRDGSQLQSSRMMMIPKRALSTFSPQVSSITFDTGQPGLDVFFEDKQFPAVLPGVVKDISFQGGQGKGYGNYVVIESIDPETNESVDILYSHLASRPNLSPGQTVRMGQIIGQQGGTGRVVSADGTIASIDFLRPAPRGSKDMTPYSNYDSLRRRIASQLRS